MNQSNIKNRTIFCDDNIDVLKGINSQSIDLIYLDPPFNKKKTFTAPIGSSAEGASFRDIFRREDVKDEWIKTIEEDNENIHDYLNSIKVIEGRTSYNFCYLAYMAIRLIQCHRVLKDTGSIYLHCDPTMSHYLKVLMDCIFTEKNFKNEITWKRTSAHNDPKQYGRVSDSILFYVKNEKDYVYNTVYKDYEESYVKSTFSRQDGHGKFRLQELTGAGVNKNDEAWGVGEEFSFHPANVGRHWSVPRRILKEFVSEEQAAKMTTNEKLELLYENDYIVISKNGVPRFKQYLDDLPGAPLQDFWDDIHWAPLRERKGYPTQKPLALLERIIKASSSEGDVVLDPFCGCATTCVAAEKLGRQWIGVDVSQKAYDLVRERVEKEVSDSEDIYKRVNEIYFYTDPPARTDLGVDEKVEQKYVYIITNKKFPGEYKVGIAKNKNTRLNHYQTGDPDRGYKMEYDFLTPHFRQIEEHIHKKFENKHEWVTGTSKEALISEIENFKG